MTDGSGLEWLLGLDYGPLTEHVDKQAVARFQVDHEAIEASLPVTQQTDDSDGWRDRLRIENFACQNRLGYVRRDDSDVYKKVDFPAEGTADVWVLDVISTPDRRVAVGSTRSADRFSRGVGILAKFVAIDLGHEVPQVKLIPRSREDRDADSILEHHFRFEGVPWDPSEGDPVFPPQQPLGPKPGLFGRVREAHEQSKAVADHNVERARRRAAGWLDDRLATLIVENAEGFHIEFVDDKVVFHRKLSGDHDFVKPDTLRELFGIAVSLGPALAAATASN